MSDVWVIGAGSTAFKKWPERSHRSLTGEVVRAALADAQIERSVEGIWFGNCAMHVFGQDNIRGQVAMAPLFAEGVLEPGTPIVNVEGGCATGTAALQGAFHAVAAGACDVGLVVGVEKTWVPGDLAKTFGLFLGGIDCMHRKEWMAFYGEAGARGGQVFEPARDRIVFIDVHAMSARHHMEKYGSTAEDLAFIAAKNHNNGKRNERAQYRFGATPESILDDRMVLEPFTRSMCAPISDGAAALLVVSGDVLKTLDPSVRDRAVRVRSCVLAGGRYRELHEEGVLERAAARAYAQSGLSPNDVEMAEVHDANAWCELHAIEALGFCERGQGAAYSRSGATGFEGARPVNVSGGLIAKGHPLGATGIAMVDELVRQMRGEAGEHQVARPPTVTLQQNAGGMIGFDEALCGVTLLDRG